MSGELPYFPQRFACKGPDWKECESRCKVFHVENHGDGSVVYVSLLCACPANSIYVIDAFE